VDINITIDVPYKRKITARLLRSTAHAVFAAEKTAPHVELGILITGQEKVRELNRDYRGKDYNTDVLSFYMTLETKEESFVEPPDNMVHLGEVIISYPQAALQAKENGHPVSKEITILLVHGILHLLGYDHETNEEDAKKMQAREEAILKNL
jgi:probable rRNA maturation factor